jgi:hypothetical protein
MKGIIVGRPGAGGESLFEPNAPATMGETAAMLRRFASRERRG